MTTPRIKVYIYADDPISQAGVSSQLRARPETEVVTDDLSAVNGAVNKVVATDDLDQAEVAVVVAESVDEKTVRVLRAVQRGRAPRTVLIAAVLDEMAVVAAAEAGVS